MPCGYLAVEDNGRILASNSTLRSWLGFQPGAGFPVTLAGLLTQASSLYLELSVLPTLQLGRQLSEVYLTLRDAAGAELPMLINFRKRPASSVTDWALMQIEQRGRWEAEILRSRQLAERQAQELSAAKQELERVLAELKESNWMLKKAAEVLPTCMYCGNVKFTADKWDSALAYLSKNEVFLSHGCCPTCEPHMREQLGLPPKA